jgi:hypothetical protein
MSWVAMAFVLTLAWWAGTMVYSWATTYPMFRDVGPAEFPAAHRTYERGLVPSVYIPFALMGLAVLAAALFRPVEIPVGAIWVAIIALAGGVVTTAFCAAPMHVQLIKEGKNVARIERMLKCNAARALAALIGFGAAIWTLSAL